MSPRARELAIRMRDTMQHRGPDDAGLWQSDDGRVWLGHRRLAIIDLSADGHQPMADGAGQIHVVFNGEIYNYKALRAELQAAGHMFRSASDTEVLVEAYRQWGTDCLSRLNGMFAFALYDEPKATLFLARDRAGEKPLFFRHVDGSLSFASELKALMADPSVRRRVNLEALEHYLAYGYVPGRRCMLDGFLKLGAGEAMTFNVSSRTVRTWAYWEVPDPCVDQAADPAELESELEELLLDSVRLRLQADVPVGVLLSGGLDSSLITAAAARVSTEPVHTFTVSFPGHGNMDESPYARLVASHFGTRHTELEVDAASVDLLPELAQQFDEPMADSSMLPTYLLSKQIRRQATVALGGDGGDELLGGYSHYARLDQQTRIANRVPHAVRAVMAGGAGRLIPSGVRGRNFLLSLGASEAASVSYNNVYFDRRARTNLVPAFRGLRSTVSPERAKQDLFVGRGGVVDRATAIDFVTYLVDDILVKVDRSSMLTSLEVRAPWLDPRIVDFAFARVPSGLKVGGGRLKILGRRLGRRVLPEALDLDRKQGFSLPLTQWFADSTWARYIEDVLTSSVDSPFASREVSQLLHMQKRGFANTHRLFALTMFELWRTGYGVSVEA